MRIILACDRSKGHLYPALNLARYIKEHHPKDKVIFCGLKKEDKNNLKSVGFRCVGLDLVFRNILLESFLRFFEALVLLVIVRPHRALGFGGRNSFFLVFISSFFMPTFLYEPNCSFGKANRILSFFVKKVFLGLKNPIKRKEISLGIPLRDEILHSCKSKVESLKHLELRSDIKTLLVFGGSLGSSFINNIFLETASLLSKRNYKFQVIHVTGSRDFNRISFLYKKLSIEARVFVFCEDFGTLYLACDVLISRSGASSVAEICFFKKPAILIPYPFASGHQLRNACFLFEKHAALLHRQESLSSQKLFNLLVPMLYKPEEFSYLQDNMKSLKVWSTQDDFSKEIIRHFYH